MLNIIPKPFFMKELEGVKTITQSSRVFVSENLKDVLSVILDEFKFIQEENCMISSHEEAADIKVVYEETLEKEAYKILCTPDCLIIKSSDYVGSFYAIQSIKQLVFFELENNKKGISIPCIDVCDKPRFEHRGLLFDEARHFFGKDECKRIIDLMAMYKLNVLHWHLTDDQGWRIEIKKYPLLTDIGSYRNDSNIHGWLSSDMEGKPHSGYYTQEEIIEIVQYASKKNITIIPEIDMPAHFAAAIAGYNWLACRDIPCEVHTFFGGYIPTKKGWLDWNRPACAGKDSTYKFIFDVIDELSSLFPAPLFHIGGDEAPKNEWRKCPECKKRMLDNGINDVEDLQGYFNNQISNYLKAKGKRLIVWNEALKANNLDNSVIGQYWTPSTDKNILKHLENGGKLIISKHQAFYFDMCYCQYPLTNTYNFEVFDNMIPSKYSESILGLEGHLWTEWIADRKKIDMQLFPRLCALSEVCWTESGEKDLQNFLERLQYHKKILKSMKVNYAEDRISMPKGYFHRLREFMLWKTKDQHREVLKNSKLKGD